MYDNHRSVRNSRLENCSRMGRFCTHPSQVALLLDRVSVTGLVLDICGSFEDDVYSMCLKADLACRTNDANHSLPANMHLDAS
jgi:hypothetical protein